MASMMAETACRPVRTRGCYGVYEMADVAALREDNRELRRRVRELVRENALLCERICRMEREWRDDDEWMNL